MDDFEAGVWAARAKLKSFAMRLYRNTDDAEDAVQDAMLRALANREKFEAGTNLMGWLGTILMNRFRHRVRREKRVVYTGDARYADHLTASDNPERAVIVSEAFDSLHSLPDVQREAVVQYGLGISYAEQAQREGVSEITVRVRAHRGRGLLKQLSPGGLAW